MPENNSTIVEDEYVNLSVLTIEVGKRYIKRNGNVTGEISLAPENARYPFMDALNSWTSKGQYYYTASGAFYHHEEEHECDLIREHVEQEVDLAEHVDSVRNVTHPELADYAFGKSINSLMRKAHETAIRSGWWVNPADAILAFFANAHGEISEAWEAWRRGNPPSEKMEGFCQMEEDLADAVIRIMDVCQANGWRLEEAILAKNEYNKSREYRHGNKNY